MLCNPWVAPPGVFNSDVVSYSKTSQRNGRVHKVARFSEPRKPRVVGSSQAYDIFLRWPSIGRECH